LEKFPGYALRPVGNNYETAALYPIQNWQDETITSEEAHQTFLSQYGREPDAVALLGGSKTPAGFYFVGLDADSDEVFNEMQKYPEFSSTRQNRGSKGGHFLLQTHEPMPSFEYSNREGVRLLEIKGTKRMIIIPPSLHRKTRQPYQQLNDNQIILIPNAFLLEALAKVAKAFNLSKAGEKQRVIDLEKGVTTGGRNETAFGMAFALKKKGVEKGQATAELLEWNSKNQPPLPEKELMAVIDSAWKYETKGNALLEQEKAKPKKEYLIEPIQAVLEKNLTPVSWIVEGILPNPALAMLAGKRATFKTTIAYLIALSAAREKEAFGLFKTIKTKTLILDGESGPYLQKTYMNRFQAQNNDDIFFSDLYQFDLSKKYDCESLTSIIEKNGFKLVIIDSFRRAFHGDENDSSIISEFLTNLRFIKDTTGATILVIHHNRKSQKMNGENPADRDIMDDLRGSSDIAAAMDLILQLERSTTATEKIFVEMRISKNRFGKEGDPFSLQAYGEDNRQISDFLATNGPVERCSEAQKEYLRFLVERNQATVKTRDFNDRFGDSTEKERKAVQRVIRELKRKGFLTNDKSPFAVDLDNCKKKLLDYESGGNIPNGLMSIV
jgi:hypothetical protein